MSFIKKLLFGKSLEELQAELKALCMRLQLQGEIDSWDMDRYEDLLAKIYKRGAKPETTLTRKENKT